MDPPSFSNISSIFLLLLLLLLLSSSLSQSQQQQVSPLQPKSSTPFATALDALQKQIGYQFKNAGLLRRAMTHSSYSRDNYRTLSVLGLHAVQASVSLACVCDDIDLSPADLSRRLAADTATDPCAADGARLGLDGIVRVSPKTNASTPAIVCGAFRAIFGAVAVDSGEVGSAGEAFRRVHRVRRDLLVSDE